MSLQRCAGCRRELPKGDFSPGQLKKVKDKRTCKRCCNASERRRDLGKRQECVEAIGAAAAIERMADLRTQRTAGARALEHGRPVRALQLFQQAAAGAQLLSASAPEHLQDQATFSELHALRGKGVALVELGRAGEAKTCFSRALRVLRNLRGDAQLSDAKDGVEVPADLSDSRQLEMWLHVAAGHAAWHDNDAGGSDSSFAAAVACAGDCDDAVGRALLLDALLGRARALRRNCQGAGESALSELDCLRKATVLLQQDGSPKQIAEALLRTAECHELSHDLRSAKQVWQQVRELCAEHRPSEDEILPLVCLYNVHDSLGEQAEAESCIADLRRRQTGRDLKLSSCRWCREHFTAASSRRIVPGCLHVFHDTCLRQQGPNAESPLSHMSSRCPSCSLQSTT